MVLNISVKYDGNMFFDWFCESDPSITQLITIKCAHML